MTYQAPYPTAPRNSAATAIAAIAVAMAVIVTAVAAVLILGGTSAAEVALTSDAASSTPSKADFVLVQAEPAQTEESTTPATTQAPVTETPVTEIPVTVPPVTVAPVTPPQPVHVSCSVSKAHVLTGETFLITGTHTPATVDVSWSFDHGDGYVDHRNPSHAFYEEAGTYTVMGIANVGGQYEQRIHCADVTAVDPGPTVYCSIDNTNIAEGGDTVFRAWNDLDAEMVYTFHHGDGYSEVANPSYATYYAPGSYDVTLDAVYQGETITVDCGTVTVYREDVPPTCPTSDVIGMTEQQAHQTIQAANCSALTILRGLEVIPHSGDYRTDRVKLVVDPFDIVRAATIG